MRERHNTNLLASMPGAATATPGTRERLVVLTTDQDDHVRQEAAWALGRLEVPEEFWDFLGKFWQAHLATSEVEFIGDRLGPVRNVSYEQLQQIAARMARQYGDRQDQSHRLV